MTDELTAKWRRFADAAGIPIPDSELEAIAAPLDRLMIAVRPALDRELGFMEPVIGFRLREDGS